MNKSASTLLVFAVSLTTSAQNLKDLATKAIDGENFAQAGAYLERAVAENPNDAEAWYRLGHSLHWLCYDTAPLFNCDNTTSDRVLECMKKALSLDPHLRNCYSVIGSEYGARAQRELQLGKLEGFIAQLRLGRKAGAYPDWLIEYGRNILASCDRDAILFTGGDAEVFPVWYCQFIDNFRTDVTLVPVPLLDRPWFLLLLKSGLSDSFPTVSMPWTREQILQMHHAKWSEHTVDVTIPPATRSQHSVKDSLFKWSIVPDLRRDNRTLLSLNRIAIAGLIKANSWSRPIHFSLGCHPWMFAGLNDRLQLHGLSQQVVPFSVAERGKIEIQEATKFLGDPNNFRRLVTLKTEDIPYISSPLNNYRVLYMMTCDSLLQRGDKKLARNILDAMETNVPESALPLPDAWRDQINDLRKRVNSN